MLFRESTRHQEVALPYHVERGVGWSGDPIATDFSSVLHFIEDIADLASERPDLRIVIRGKNDDWISDHRFAAARSRTESLPNLSVSREYGRLNETYRLCANAHLIIAKHTSLVDEALALGIPCVLHDYTSNSRGYARLAVEYLPRRLWAEDPGELRQVPPNDCRPTTRLHSRSATLRAV